MKQILFLSECKTRMILALIAMCALAFIPRSYAALIETKVTAGKIIVGGGADPEGSSLGYSVSQDMREASGLIRLSKPNYASTQFIYVVLDVGSLNLADNQRIDKIEIVNRTTSTTSLAIRSLSILVSSTEGNSDFNPYNIASYDTSVFAQGVLSPSTNTAGETQAASILPSNKRYFLISISNNFLTGANGFPAKGVTWADGNTVQFFDIKVSVAP